MTEPLDQQKAARDLVEIVTGEKVHRQDRDEKGRSVARDAAATGDGPVPIRKSRRDLGLDILSTLDGDGANHRGGQRWDG